MSSRENQQQSPAEGLRIPGLVQNQESVEQLSFGVNPLTPVPLAAPEYQNGGPNLAEEDTTPQLTARNGIAETPLPQSASVGYTGGPGSLAGLAEMYLTAQPVSQAGIAETPLPQPFSGGYTNGPSSLAGLAEMDTAQQPASQVEVADAQTSQRTPAGFNAGNASVVSRPISQAGLGGALVTQRLIVRESTHALLLGSQPGTTQTLGDARPDPQTTASRPPVVIRGSHQGTAHLVRPPQGRRHVISIAALVLLLVITVGTLLAVSPLGRDVRATAGMQTGAPNLIAGTPNNMKLVSQATATAVVHQQNDGYDPASNGGGAILTGSPETWPYGVCTYWANLRYHELTGHWVTWLGNAYQWADGAGLAGWHVSTTPHVPSIIVLQPGVQGASGYGHVAVVESVSGNVAHTSNMNWYTNGGGYGIVSYNDFTVGAGVSFIWA